MLTYELNDHRHRFSVWAAARAAQRGLTDVVTLRKALEKCGIVEFLTNANLDDVDDTRFTQLHRMWCRSVVGFLKEAGVTKITYGRAAKLLAIYIKSVVILGPACTTVFARIAHPPIDAILLKNLAASEINQAHKTSWAKIKWTHLNEDEYHQLIEELRGVLAPKEPFWKLERFWTVTNDGSD